MAKLENVGILHFDVPDEIKSFAGRLRHRLRKGRALPASKSVYIVNWGDVPGIEGMILDAKEGFREKYPEDAHKVDAFIADFLKVDDVTAEKAHEMAVRGLSHLISEIGRSLKLQLKKIEKLGEAELPRRIQITLINKLKEIECLVVAFRLMEDVDVALEAQRKAIMAQLAAEVMAKHLKLEGAAS